MAKKFKVTVKHYLNRKITIEKATVNWDMVSFFDGEGFASPLYVQIIVKRQNTRIKSPGLGMKERSYPQQQYKQTLFETEKQIIQKTVTLLEPYQNEKFTIAGITSILQIAVQPIDQLFNYHLKKIYHETIFNRIKDPAVHELAALTDWHKTEVDQIQHVYRRVYPNYFDNLEYNFFTVAFQCVKAYAKEHYTGKRFSLLDYIVNNSQNEFFDLLPELTAKHFVPPFNEEKYIKKVQRRIIDQITLAVFEAYRKMIGISTTGYPNFNSEEDKSQHLHFERITIQKHFLDQVVNNVSEVINP